MLSNLQALVSAYEIRKKQTLVIFFRIICDAVLISFGFHLDTTQTHQTSEKASVDQMSLWASL